MRKNHQCASFCVGSSIEQIPRRTGRGRADQQQFFFQKVRTQQRSRSIAPPLFIRELRLRRGAGRLGAPIRGCRIFQPPRHFLEALRLSQGVHTQPGAPPRCPEAAPIKHIQQIKKSPAGGPEASPRSPGGHSQRPHSRLLRGLSRGFGGPPKRSGPPPRGPGPPQQARGPVLEALGASWRPGRPGASLGP